MKGKDGKRPIAVANPVSKRKVKAMAAKKRRRKKGRKNPSRKRTARKRTKRNPSAPRTHRRRRHGKRKNPARKRRHARKRNPGHPPRRASRRRARRRNPSFPWGLVVAAPLASLVTGFFVDVVPKLSSKVAFDPLWGPVVKYGTAGLVLVGGTVAAFKWPHVGIAVQSIGSDRLFARPLYNEVAKLLAPKPVQSQVMAAPSDAGAAPAMGAVDILPEGHQLGIGAIDILDDVHGIGSIAFAPG